MPIDLTHIPLVVNEVFDILDLFVVRCTLLGLVALGAIALLRKHTP